MAEDVQLSPTPVKIYKDFHQVDIFCRICGLDLSTTKTKPAFRPHADGKKSSGQKGLCWNSRGSWPRWYHRWIAHLRWLTIVCDLQKLQLKGLQVVKGAGWDCQISINILGVWEFKQHDGKCCWTYYFKKAALLKIPTWFWSEPQNDSQTVFLKDRCSPLN